MKEKLEQYLDELVLLLKDGGAFALEQLPIFVQEYLTYYAWYHGIMGFWFLIITVILVSFGIWIFKSLKDEEFLGIFPIAFSIGTVLGAGYHFLYLLQILIAPRVYLIENLTNML